MIAVEALTFGYRRSEPVIHALTLELAAGSMTAITGKSGRGKSTLLYLMGLLLSPQGGSLWINHCCTSTLNDSQRSLLRGRQIGFVFQDAALDGSRSILANVLEGVAFTGGDRRSAKARALSLLREMEVAVDPHRKPGQISGGQAQRVALCRALLPSPSILLADEPTGNLDGESAATVISRLRQEARAGACVVVATHDPRVLAACDDAVDLS